MAELDRKVILIVDDGGSSIETAIKLIRQLNEMNEPFIVMVDSTPGSIGKIEYDLPRVPVLREFEKVREVSKHQIFPDNKSKYHN